MGASAVFVVVLGAIAAVAAVTDLTTRERALAWWSFAAHVVGSFVQWGMGEYYYEFNDAHGYRDDGVELARLLDYDPVRWGPEVAKLALHMDVKFPFELAWSGTSGTMSAMTGVLIYLLGPSLISSSLVCSWLCWFGQVSFYRVAREGMAANARTPAVIGCLFVPSVIYWGSGLVKEAVVMGAFGYLALSTYRVVRNRRMGYISGIAVSGLVVAMIKPYVLFPYVLALGAWIYVAAASEGRRRLRFRPAYLVLAGALVVGGLAEMGSLFPEFSATNVAASVATQQELWRQTVGGSSTELGSGEARTPIQQLPFVPIALINALFRPVIFEVRNVAQFGAAIETMLLAAGFLSLLRRGTRKVVWEAIKREPLLAFCFVFVASFAVAVGLATSNLGSLSRYRLPMMPFYATALLVLRQKTRSVVRMPVLTRGVRAGPGAASA